MKKFYLVLNRCTHGNKFISIDDEMGSGIRLTSQRRGSMEEDDPCCNCRCNGSETEQKWRLTERDMREAIISFKSALEGMERMAHDE